MNSIPLEFSHPGCTTLYILGGSLLFGLTRIVKGGSTAIYLVALRILHPKTPFTPKEWKDLKQTGITVLKGFTELIPILSGIAFTLWYYRHDLFEDEDEPVPIGEIKYRASIDNESNVKRWEAFLLGDGKLKLTDCTPSDVSFEQMMKWEDVWVKSSRKGWQPVPGNFWEDSHTYIQYLFATQTLSKAQPEIAPVLYEDQYRPLIDRVRASPVAQMRIRQAFSRMMSFYGIDVIETEREVKLKAREPDFSNRLRWWTQDPTGGHNLQRVARILSSLQLFGCHEHKRSLLEFLTRNYEENPNVPDEFKKSYRDFWSQI